MKKILLYSLTGVMLCFTSCALFELDNYDEPKETIRGVVVDAATGEPVLTEQAGSEGIRVRMTELSWGDNVTHNPDFYCMPDGTFRNTKIFAGRYHVTVDGPFIPIIREDTRGVPISDDSYEVDVKGVTEVKFEVHPFLKLEWDGEPTVSNGRITARVKVDRAVEPALFRELIEPTVDNYSDALMNVTDVQLFVSYSSTVGNSNKDDRWSTQIEYSGASFETQLGQPLTIKSTGTIPSGRKVFIRAAARINYQTAEQYRFNYTQPLEIIIP